MRKVLYFALCLLVLTSCKEEAKPTVVEVVNNEAIDSLQRIVDQREAEINEWMTTFNDIQEGFRLISEAEQRTVLAKGGEGADRKQQILKDIQFIQNKMDENRKLIDKLRGQLDESTIKSDQFKKTIEVMVSQLEEKTRLVEHLTQEVNARDSRINEMSENISILNNDVADLKNESSQKSQTISEQDKKLHTAYYVYGTKGELKEQGILDKNGEVLRKDFNKNYFTKIDIRQQKDLKFYSKKVKFLTSHPASSYRLDADASKQLTLHITDPDAFWQTSRYLVVLVK